MTLKELLPVLKRNFELEWFEKSNYKMIRKSMEQELFGRSLLQDYLDCRVVNIYSEVKASMGLVNDAFKYSTIIVVIDKEGLL